MALGLFGGAFDPPHLTHAAIARVALAQLPIGRLLVLPSGEHPLKGRSAAPAAARVELCRLAFAGIAGVEISEWEVAREGPGYTVDTLRHFAEDEAGGGRPYWIMGSDNLATLGSWRDPHEVLRLAVVAVYPRAGFPVEPLLERTDDLLTDDERSELRAHVLRVEPDDASATTVRRALATGADTHDLLHPDVARRIAELDLYRDGEGAGR